MHRSVPGLNKAIVAALSRRDASAAERQARAALQLHPNDPQLLRLLGVALHLQRRHDEGLLALDAAVAIAPDLAEAHSNRGSLLRALGKGQEALHALERATQLAPDLAAVWFNYGKALKAYAHIERAQVALERAVALDGRHFAALSTLADTCKALGQIERAAELYRRVVLGEPGEGAAWWGLANLKTRKMTAADADSLRRALSTPPRDTERHAQMQFALAKALDDLGDPDASFAVLSTANALKRSVLPWDAGQFTRKVDALIAAFGMVASDPASASSGSLLGKEVIFIVGLPRSGSTLVEQILAAHPSVSGASELPDLPAVIAAESRRRGQDYPQWCAAAGASDWQRLGQSYLQRTARWRQQRPISTDKLPDNFVHVGALRLMLPAARIIDVRRDPTDTCLSCFQQYFAHGNAFSYSIDDLGDYVSDYLRLMSHWQQQFPGCVERIDYEQLVSDPPARIRRLLEFCDLPFHPDCLAAHQVQREIRTASAAQVREPLDRRGLDRAQPYLKHLAGLRQRLAPE